MGKSEKRNYGQYNAKMFYAVASDRGYGSIESISKGLSKVLGKSTVTARGIIANGTFTYNQICAVADFLEMTPKEFCMVFFDDCFKENSSGRIVFSLDGKRNE